MDESDCPPKFSIVIACLNVDKVLGRCLESIWRQSFHAYEVLVEDGGSSDTTPDLLRRHSEREPSRLIWNSEADNGIADAWNRALTKAKGEWLMFLGADDMLLDDDVLARIAPKLPKIGPRVAYGTVQMQDADGRFLGYLGGSWNPEEFRSCKRNLPHQGVFHHRSLFDDHGPFDTTLKVVSDYEFLLRELLHVTPLFLEDEVIARMQWGGISMRRSDAIRPIAEQIALHKRFHSRPSVVLYWWLAKASVIQSIARMIGEKRALNTVNLYRRIFGRRAPLQY